MHLKTYNYIYTDEMLRVLGGVQVDAIYQKQWANLRLVVVAENGIIIVQRGLVGRFESHSNYIQQCAPKVYVYSSRDA